MSLCPSAPTDSKAIQKMFLAGNTSLVLPREKDVPSQAGTPREQMHACGTHVETGRAIHTDMASTHVGELRDGYTVIHTLE